MGWILAYYKHLWDYFVKFSTFLVGFLATIGGILATLFSMIRAYSTSLGALWSSVSSINNTLGQSIAEINNWFTQHISDVQFAAFWYHFIHFTALDECVSALATHINLTITFLGLSFSVIIPVVLASITLSIPRLVLEIKKLLLF